MAEALGAAGSIVGIVALGLTLATILHTHMESVSDAAARLRDVTFEISSTASALSQLQDIISEDDRSDQSRERVVKIFKDHTKKEILGVAFQCEDLYKKIVVFVSKAGRSGKDGKVLSPNSVDLAALKISGLNQRLRWPWLEPRIKGCQESLRWLKMNLLFMLQVATIARFQISKSELLPGDFNEQQALTATLERLRKRRAEYVASKRKPRRKNSKPTQGNPITSSPTIDISRKDSPVGASNLQNVGNSELSDNESLSSDGGVAKISVGDANPSSSSPPPSQLKNVDKALPLVKAGTGHISDPLPNITAATNHNPKKLEPQPSGKALKLFPFNLRSKQRVSIPPSPRDISPPETVFANVNTNRPGLPIRAPTNASPPPSPPPPLPRHLTHGAPPPSLRGIPGRPSMPLQIPTESGSTWTQDVTPRKALDEAACIERLTTYRVYTIQKEISGNAKPTWAKVLIKQEVLEEDEVAEQVKKLSKKSVFDKKLALSKCQEDQVGNLLDRLIRAEQDPNFEWVLSQLDKRRKGLGYKSKKRAVIIVYTKRAPIRGVNSILLHQAVERATNERLAPRPSPLFRKPAAHPVSPVIMERERESNSLRALMGPVRPASAMYYERSNLPGRDVPRTRFLASNPDQKLPSKKYHNTSASSNSSSTSFISGGSRRRAVLTAYPGSIRSRRLRDRSRSHSHTREHFKQNQSGMTIASAGYSIHQRQDPQDSPSGDESGDQDEPVSASDIDDEDDNFGLKIDFDKEDEEAKLSIDALLDKLTNVKPGVVEVKEVP